MKTYLNKAQNIYDIMAICCNFLYNNKELKSCL